ncbi:MAG: hypothetical protein HYW22_02760 [Candidatus Aenigmarchaeota archaeon]|nr:hypothetical protein [Candidatus Aenigmarchaeota archaeon]
MVQVLEQQLFRLHGLQDSWVEVELTPEEVSKLGPLDNTYMIGSYHVGHLGFFDPRKVKRYFVDRLGKTFTGSPTEAHVTILAENHWHGFIGTYWMVHKEGSNEYGVYMGPVYRDDPIDVSYVRDDESGTIVPVTREKVEGEIAYAYRRIDEGFGADLRRIGNLVNASGLDFAAEVERLAKYDDDVSFKRYNAPEHLRELIPELVRELGDYATLEHIGESGVGEKLDEFFGLLPKLTIPEDLVSDVDRIKANYLNAYDRAIEEKQDEIKEAEERIEGLRARKARHRQQLVYVPVPEQLSLE